MSKKQRWIVGFAGDLDLGEMTVAQAHGLMMRLREDLDDAGFPTEDFRAMLAPAPSPDPEKAQSA